MDPSATPHDDAVPTGPESFPASGPNALAGLGRRLLARVVDSLVLAVPAMVVVLTAVDVDVEPDELRIPLGVVAALLALTVSYEVLFIGWRGQTPGKMALGIRVASFADGANPSWSAAAIRSLLPTAAGALPFGLGLLGILVYASAAWDRMRRGWHDKAAGTVVVRAR